jgi:cell division protein FtsN
VSDEGFHEIQLNGKQLVFLFMATTVVLVLTFLFGVIVGRNARPGTTDVAGMAPVEVAPDPGVAPVADSPAPPPVRGAAAPMETAAPKPSEELSYADRLLREGAAEENLKPAASTKPAASAPPPAPAPSRESAAPPREAAAPPREQTAPREKPTVEHAPAVQEPVPASPPAPRQAPPTPPPTPAATAPVATAAASSDPSGPGIAVQVAAYKDRQEADSLAKKLIAKGYPAFVMDPVKGAPTAFFRVRVGKYKTLKDAQAIMAKLQTAEQFNTAWIAR